MIMNKKEETKSDDIVKKGLLLLFLVSISAFRLNWAIALPAFTLIVIYSLIIDGKLAITCILKWGLVFWGYYLLSILWGHDTSDTLRYASAIIYIIGIFIFLPKLIKDKEDLNMSLRMIFYSIAITAVLVLLMTPLSEIGTERIGSVLGLNENTFGMRMAIGAMIAMYLLRNKDKKINKVLIVLFTVIFSVLTLLSGSKKGLILLLIGILAVTFIYSAGRQRLRRILGLLIVISGLLFLVFNNSVLYSTIGNRIERTFLTVTGQDSDNLSLQVIGKTVGTTDKSLVERDFYKKQAIELFLRYPLFGYGGNNFTTRMREINYSHIAYSHNNFTELLCTLGIIGFVIYYSYWLILLYRLYIIKKNSSNLQIKRMSLLFMSIMIMFILLDYGNVSYVLEFNMFILCLIDIFSRIARKEIEDEKYIHD